FTQHLMMGHNGLFGGFLKEVRENGGLQSELMDQTNLPVILLGFDGSPVYEDTSVLIRWLDVTEKYKNSRSATLF
ncbi:cellulose biosynthesis protein BcsG, partial [Escherichia coli]|uniref:cellulose biosynthesis protein BcsG n=1 Tax=Escherichia coli TaxID=562 RepID=UPI00210924D3